MLKALPADKLAALWKQLADAGGKYLGHGDTPQIKPISGYTAVYVPCRWENNAVDLKVVYGKDRHISGLWIVKTGED